MYRDFSAMVEGWTKNLALLFAHPLGLAVLRSLEFAVMACLLAAAIAACSQREYAVAIINFAVGALFYTFFLRRILRAHFPLAANLLSFFGLPLYAGLLVRSWLHSRVRGAVTWKGRTYAQSVTEPRGNSSISDRS